MTSLLAKQRPVRKPTGEPHPIKMLLMEKRISQRIFGEHIGIASNSLINEYLNGTKNIPDRVKKEMDKLYKQLLKESADEKEKGAA